MMRFWFQFEFDDKANIPPGLIMGCGITAYDYSDALLILKQKIFNDQKLPRIRKVIKDIDISTLDAGHVIPNINPPSIRGVWFHLGYS